MLPGVIVAIVIATLFGAPIAVLVSIGGFGFVTAMILILLGDRSKNVNA